MTNDIIPFDFEGKQLRSVRLEDGEPGFIAQDACQMLELPNVSQALSRLDDDEKGDIILNDAAGRPNKLTYVTESGLYALILSSRKPSAKAVKRWVTHDVLPAIRKTGGYTTRPMSPAETALMHAQILVDQERRLAIVEREQTAQQDRLALVEAEQATTKGGLQMMTVAGYAKWKGLALSDGELSSAGRKCTAYSNANGYPIGKVPHTRLGAINTYHVKVLELYFSQRNLFEGGAK